MTDTAAPALLERRYEQAELDAVVASAPESRGITAMITGPAGIGKTALLDAARARASDLGVRVLAARGGELERDFGFGVARQLLEPVLARAGADERRRLTAGAAALGARVFATEPPGPEGATDSPDAVVHGLYWMIANLAEQTPVLLAVDDVHWADRPSLRFLVYLARRLEGMRAAMAMAVRSGDPASDGELLRLLEVESHPVVIRPRPLSEAAVSVLLEARLDGTDRELCRACHDATGGNPFLVTALLEELRREGRTVTDLDPAIVGRFASDRIKAAVLLRVGRLGQEALELARSIAVLGEHAIPAHAAAVAGLAPQAAAPAADALRQASILGPGQPLRFAHPLVRTAIHEDIAEGARSALHAGAATVLGEAGEPADAVALHLLAIEPSGDPSVVARLREAAEAAAGRGAPEAASRYLRRAMAEPPPEEQRADLTVQLGEVAWRAGEDDHVELMGRALELAREPGERARAALSLGQALMFVGRVEEAVDVVEGALADLDDEGLRVGLEVMLIVAGITDLGARRRLLPLLSEARSKADRSPNPGILSLLTTEVALSGGTASEVAGLAERALADESLLHGPMVETPLPYPAAFWLTLVDRPRIAGAAMSTALAEARDRGSLAGTGFPLAYRALAALRMGDLAEAEADARAAIEAGGGIPYGNAVGILIQVLVERGEQDEARALAERAVGDVPDPEIVPMQLLREARCRLALAEGDAAGALAEALACGRWEERIGTAAVVPVAWRSLGALAHHALGEPDEAGRLAGEEVALARRFGAPRSVGAALRVAGLVEPGDRGLELLLDAVASLERSEDILERARATVDLGAALRRGGQRTEARERLAAGMDLAHRCGARALVSRALDELRIAGARPRRPAMTGRESLTASEQRVAGMAADGMTNPEIAQALFVSLRTVEMHLSNTYRKLEIRSRKQLPEALARQISDDGPEKPSVPTP